jgi:hypothetical protein
MYYHFNYYMFVENYREFLDAFSKTSPNVKHIVIHLTEMFISFVGHVSYVTMSLTCPCGRFL